MRQTSQMIVKCCICGREKTEYGWEYVFQAPQNEMVYSHGFCSVCYEKELMKAKMHHLSPALCVYGEA